MRMKISLGIKYPSRINDSRVYDFTFKLKPTMDRHR